MDRQIQIPVEIFKDRGVAVLESLVEYLKDTYGLSYAEIGRLLNRNERTVWTVYRRAKEKRR
ncbi:MAG: sigma factor-like helix-turn-helix DNA-binding protein [Candidatus Woesearchaeota archaeon]